MMCEEPRSDPGFFIDVVWLLQPELFSGRKVNVEVGTISPLTTGMNVIDCGVLAVGQRMPTWFETLMLPDFATPSLRAFAVCPSGGRIHNLSNVVTRATFEEVGRDSIPMNLTRISD
jgi:hypothetical protein